MVDVPRCVRNKEETLKFRSKNEGRGAAVAKQERKTVAKRGDLRCSERRQEFSSEQQKKKRKQRHKRQQHC